MTNTKALKAFATDEQILECLILFEERKMEAAKLLASYMFPKWQVTTLDAVKILMNVQKEMSEMLVPRTYTLLGISSTA